MNHCEKKKSEDKKQMVFCYQNCSSDDREKLLRSLEQFIQTVKGQNNFWYLTEYFINLFLGVSHI